MFNEPSDEEWGDYPAPAPYSSDVDDSAPFEEVSPHSLDGTEGTAIANNRLVLSEDEAEFAAQLRSEWLEDEEARIEEEARRRPDPEAAAEVRALREELQLKLAEELGIEDTYTTFRDRQQEYRGE